MRSGGAHAIPFVAGHDRYDQPTRGRRRALRLAIHFSASRMADGATFKKKADKSTHRQHQRFVDAARKVDASEDETDFDDILKRVASAASPKTVRKWKSNKPKKTKPPRWLGAYEADQTGN